MNFKIRLRRFIAKNFGFFVEWIYRFKFKFLNFNTPPIIILTPGKVGSSSIYTTLKKEILNPVFHIHNLSEEGIRKSINTHINSDRKSIPLHLIVSKLLRKKAQSYKGKIYIVTIIREPISREVSSFFQNIEFHKKILENKNLEVDVQKAHRILNQKLESDICNQLESWFDIEIMNNFGIDVFSKSFDHKKKYMIFQNKKIDLLLLKMEDLDAVFPEAIKEFLGLSSTFPLTKSNLADQKYYSKAYKEVKNKTKLNTEAIKGIINSQYFSHFYSHEKDMVIQKWSNKQLN